MKGTLADPSPNEGRWRLLTIISGNGECMWNVPEAALLTGSTNGYLKRPSSCPDCNVRFFRLGNFQDEILMECAPSLCTWLGNHQCFCESQWLSNCRHEWTVSFYRYNLKRQGFWWQTKLFRTYSQEKPFASLGFVYPWAKWWSFSGDHCQPWVWLYLLFQPNEVRVSFYRPRSLALFHNKYKGRHIVAPFPISAMVGSSYIFVAF